MPRLLALLAALLLAPFATAAGAPDRFAAGQIWEYRTRPQDRGSLIWIHSVEQDPRLGAIYHIGMVGLHFDVIEGPQPIGHLPVSRATLDASVTRLSGEKPGFMDVEEGIAQWREARGGVFTITLAEIADVVERTMQPHRAATP